MRNRIDYATLSSNHKNFFIGALLIAGDDRYETEIRNISGYIRKLPDGQKASERAVALAQSLGYDLAGNETYVQPFERSSWIIRK